MIPGTGAATAWWDLSLPVEGEALVSLIGTYLPVARPLDVH